MVQSNLPYYLGFSHFLGIGPHKFEALIKYFGDAERAYNAKEEQLVKVIGVNWAQRFIQFRNEFDLIKKLDELKRKSIAILTQENQLYPQALRVIPDPPICLYVRGDLKKFDFNPSIDGDFFFAIVGTRKPTSYGEQITRKFASELASVGFVIVSGMAIGIDAAAHRAALEVGGRTVAFLGCGVDVIYPWVNHRLYEQMIESRGVVISEFPPGQTVQKGLFVARNRLISGLSKGVLVVEGTKDSGSLITARYAANQGKDVFAPPVPLTSNLSEAPNILLKQGARLVTEVSDILDEFNLKLQPKKEKQILSSLSGEEKVIFEEILKEPKLSDDLMTLSGYAINKTLNILTTLEIKGVVRKNNEGRYEVVNY